MKHMQFFNSQADMDNFLNNPRIKVIRISNFLSSEDEKIYTVVYEIID